MCNHVWLLVQGTDEFRKFACLFCPHIRYEFRKGAMPVERFMEEWRQLRKLRPLKSYEGW